MNLLKIVLASSASLLAMTAHAQADPLFTPLTLMLFSGPLGAVLGPGAIYAGLQALTYGALIAGQLVMSLGNRQKIDPGELKNTFQESEMSEVNAIGRVRLGGLKAFGNTKGGVINRLVWHCASDLVQTERYFLGGREVVLKANGQVDSPPWVTKTGSYCVIQSKPGNGAETAWPDLISRFPNLWTWDHRCRGIFQSLLAFIVPDLSSEAGIKKQQKLYQGGTPDLEVEAVVNRVYDPRDPTQSRDDKATWKWRDNGVLCAAHIMGMYPDLKAWDFDWADLALEATKADAPVWTRFGTEPRARCWGVWMSESRRGDTMQQVLDSIGAEVRMSEAGLIQIKLIDDAPASELAFSERNNIELTWKSGPEAVERPNRCRIKYYSPERNYEMAEIDMSGIAWATVPTEIDRYGEKIFDVELPFCPSASQAQRIARRLFMLARAEAGAAKTNMIGLTAWGKTYANIEDVDAGEMMLSKIASPRIDDAAGTVDIPYVVWPRELIDFPWSPPTMEALPPIIAPDIEYEGDVAVPDVPSNAILVQLTDGSYEARVRIAESGVPTGGGSPFLPGAGSGTTGNIEAVVRTRNGGIYSARVGMVEYKTRAYAASEIADRAEFQARRFNEDDDASNFSAALVVEPWVLSTGIASAPTLTASYSDPEAKIVVKINDPLAVRIVVERAVDFGSFSVIADKIARPDVTFTYTYDLPASTTSARRFRIRVKQYSTGGHISDYFDAEVSVPKVDTD